MVRLTATLGFLAAAVLLSGTGMAAPEDTAAYLENYATHVYMNAYAQARALAGDAPAFVGDAVESVDPSGLVGQVDAASAAAVDTASAAAQPALDAVGGVDPDAVLGLVPDPLAAAQAAVDQAYPGVQPVVDAANAQANGAIDLATHAADDVPGTVDALPGMVDDATTGLTTAATGMVNGFTHATQGAQDYANGVVWHWYRAAKGAGP